MRRRSAFTLIELLVVISIIGVLIALLLPAVQAAREAARRTQCINNLRQLSIALQNYHSSSNLFPMSSVNGNGHGNGQTCFTLILPFLEQKPLHAAYNFQVEFYTTANSTVVSTQLSGMICPSNPQFDRRPASDLKSLSGVPPTVPGTSIFARNHYAANWGGGRGTWGADFVRNKQTSRGVMMTIASLDSTGKPNSCVRIEQITDGSAMTVLLGEKRDGQGWGIGGWAASEFDVNIGPELQGDDPLARQVYTGSLHPGGPGFAMCDGSVKSFKPTIDKMIWYGLITRNGREVISADAY